MPKKVQLQQRHVTKIFDRNFQGMDILTWLCRDNSNTYENEMITQKVRTSIQVLKVRQIHVFIQKTNCSWVAKVCKAENFTFDCFAQVLI